MGHLGLRHRGNVRLRRLQAHPAAHWQAGDCGHGASDASNELGRGQPLLAHALRLCGRRRSQQRSRQVRRLPMGHLGLRHRGNVRLRRPQAHPAAHWQAGDCGHGASDASNELGRGRPLLAHALRLCGRRRSRQRSRQVRRLPMGHLGLRHRGNVRLRRLQAHPAAHWQAGDCGHGASDASNELGRGQPLLAHALRLCGRRRSRQRSRQVRRLPMGYLGLRHRGNVRLRRPAGTPGSALAGRRLRPRR